MKGKAFSITKTVDIPGAIKTISYTDEIHGKIKFIHKILNMKFLKNHFDNRWLITHREPYGVRGVYKKK